MRADRQFDRRRHGIVARCGAMAALAVVSAACGTTVPQTTRLSLAGPNSQVGGVTADSGDGAQAATTADGGVGTQQSFNLGVGSPTTGGATASLPGQPVAASQGSGTGQNSSNLSVPSGTGPRASTRGVAGAKPTASSSKRSGPRPSARASAGATGGGRTGSASTGATVANTPIVVGLEYSSDFDQSVAATGAVGLSSGDLPALAQALADDINAHGGLVGRKVTVLLHDTSTAQALSNPATSAQALCSDFLEDHHVDFAMVLDATTSDCLVQAHVPTAQYARVSPVDADQAYLGPRSPYLYLPTVFTADSFYPFFFNRLAAQGYFPAGAKIGILYGNFPSEVRQEKQIESLLSQRGVTVASTFEYDTSNAAAIQSGVSSSVLRFQTAGVDHVIGLDSNVALFMVQAQQQQYKPRYSISTYQGPTDVVLAVAPAAQLDGAVGVGWQPVSDVAPAQGQLNSPAKAACDAIIAKTGQQLTAASALFAAYSLCDSFGILSQGAPPGSHSFDAASLRSALTVVGNNFPTALNLAGGYSASVSAPVSAARDLAFNSSCSCFQYSSTQLRSS